MIAKILLIGCGDIAIRLSRELAAPELEFYGLRRSVDKLPSHIRGIAWDLNREQGLANRIQGFDVVVITPVPNSRDESGYRQAYEHNVGKIVRALESSSAKPKLAILVSSSGVYPQNKGEWVDEHSPTEADNFRAEALLAGENLLRNSSLEHCIVRFSGIYGPGRERLIRQVMNHESNSRDADISNRIHSEDCAGVLAHLIRKQVAGESIQSLYLASDDEPTPLAEVKRWLATQLRVEWDVDWTEEKPGGKRCCNQRLLASGYEFRYPSFREGYTEMLSARKAQAKKGDQ
ncbi:NAD(P)H-binding protein [Proteobacteria bacterium 005FR1]|nr:NAD(P)H-binding protein [Proteobacteria bacterium 005FR1]